ncbi:MAG: hypothetical protein WBD27_10640 [Pyrinomonadaceae bacterium]
MKREDIFRNLLVAAFIAAMVFQFTTGVEAASGDLDPTFGSGGKVVTQTGYDDKIKAIAIQLDGKIVVVGRRDAFYPYQGGLIARYNADGSLDQSFGVGGFVTDAAHGGHTTYFNAVAIQTDGKIVAAGYFFESGGCMRDQSWVVRYNADGSRDTTFGGDGEVEYPYLYVNGCPVDSYHFGVAVQNNGRIVVAGASENSAGNLDFAAARLNANGTLDTSFNLDGLATISIGTSTDVANAVRIQPVTGKILLAGYSYNSATGNDFALVMLNSNGLYDLSFGNFGKVTTDTGWDDRINSVALSGSNIVAAGTQSNSANGVDFSLARFNSTNGILDTTFDGDGKVKTAFGAYYDIAFGVAIQSDGKIVAAGYGRGWSDTSYNFAISRYNTNGSLDTTFNVDGKQTTDFSGYADYGTAVAIQPDGKILVAGYAWNGLDYDIALARYLP